MEFLALAKARKSVRAFTEGEVPQAALDAILEAARYAPSAGNRQPWHFYIIRDKEIAARIEAAALGQRFITAAAVNIVVCAEPERCAERYGDRGRTLYCIQDTAAAVQNILLCAKDLGFGTCWVGAFDEAGVAEAIGVDKTRRPVAVIPLGVPAEEPAPRPRREIGDIVTVL